MRGVSCEGTEDASERLDVRSFPIDFMKLEKQLVIFSQMSLILLGFSRQFFGDWVRLAREDIPILCGRRAGPRRLSRRQRQVSL